MTTKSTTMHRVLAIALILASTTAFGAPPPGTLGEISAKAKDKYDAQRRELATRGKAAQSAADSGNFVVWKEAHAAYLETLSNLTMICESNVADLSMSTSDYATIGANPILTAVQSYVKIAGSMLSQRLQLNAFANLIVRSDPAGIRPLLDAMVHVYFTGE